MSDELTGGIMAFYKPQGRYVRVVATDGDKYVRYVVNDVPDIAKACCFYKRPFERQGGKEYRYAAKLLSGKKRGCPLDTNFWEKSEEA